MIQIGRKQIGGRLTASVMMVMLVSSVATSNAQSDSIVWKLKQDDAFSVVLKQNSKSETRIDSRETTVENSTTIGMDWRVTKIADNGDATIEQSLTGVQLSVTGFTRKKKGPAASPLMAISFDTASSEEISKESKRLMKQIQPLLGLKFEVLMSPQGEIKDVVIPADLTAILNEMPDTQRLRQLFSKAGLKDILGASAMVLPVELKTGQSWTDESDASTELGDFARKRTYTYVGQKTVDGRAVAEFALNVALEPKVLSSEKQVGARKDSLKGTLNEFTGSGTLLMDVADGYFKSSSIENKATTEKPYREKIINTVVANQIEMVVTKK